MPVVTGLRELRGGRVAVELDGARWRTLPLDVVASLRIAVGEHLERPRLRELARELRRARAVETALRAVSRRERSLVELDGKLRRRGFAPGLREETLSRLERAGLVDDERYALRRAESLADRGQGDEAIRWRLGLDGVPEDVVARALASLPPEAERARRVVARRGTGARAARELARRGFGEAAVEEALGRAVADAP